MFKLAHKMDIVNGTVSEITANNFSFVEKSSEE
jgi:hypothetical protein